MHVGKNDLDDGAGDQGMFEYATDETEDAVSLTHQMATRMWKKFSDVRKNGDPWWFRAHGKTQVTIEHVEGTDESLNPRTNPHFCHARHSSSPRAGNPTINATSLANS